MVWHEEINEIKKRDTLSKKQGGEESVKKHHEKGRLTIRERIDCLLDSKTFDELGVGAGVPVFDDNNEFCIFVCRCSRRAGYASVRRRIFVSWHVLIGARP